MKQNKIILVVLDGVGIGELPDAVSFGDAGTNTLANTARTVGGLRLPNLQRLGLGNVVPIAGVAPVQHADGCYGKMAERSNAKDSTIGHWELAGVVTERAFPVYPGGFPKDLLQKFLEATNCKGFLGNKPASGTEIIKELGDEHVRSGYPIIYTSGDSVFQIAAHEEVMPLEKLYEICKKTRDHVVVGKHRVGRVIARPFVGSSGKYARTPNRKDYAVEPPGKTILDLLSQNGVDTVSIGKIDDLFSGRGLREKIHTKSNAEGIREIVSVGGKMKEGFLMVNLVDFDMLYGHRQDPRGFAGALEDFDSTLPAIMDCVRDGDMLMITGDHGNDPTDKSTDHSREYVPILCFAKSGKKNVNLGIRTSFADAGKTVAHFFGIENDLAGESFLGSITSN
ncbi:MAG: phosphopentomutase [Ignavibacteriales bacterium]|nr:phosphopentomutase [Ignavibacteriales bacterium]